MRQPITPELVIRLAQQSDAVRKRFIARLSPADALRFDAMFEAWAHDGQRPPAGNQWRTWLILAGRGYGKTRAGAEWIHSLAAVPGRVRIALVGASIAEARAVMVEGTSGLIAVARGNGVKLKWEPSLGRLSWPRGGQAQIFSGDHGDGLRGPEHHYAWCDELAPGAGGCRGCCAGGSAANGRRGRMPSATYSPCSTRRASPRSSCPTASSPAWSA